MADRARLGDEAAKARQELLTPIAKAWSTDVGVEVASLGVQVHGGMGFIEETGAAQHYRDARIAPIYEGTNGVQALDLIGRKLAGDGGAAMTRPWIADMRIGYDEPLSRGRRRPGIGHRLAAGPPRPRRHGRRHGLSETGRRCGGRLHAGPPGRRRL